MRIIFYIYLVVISILAGCGTAQQFISTSVKNQVVKAKNGSDMLLGNCTRSCLLQKPFSEWFEKNYIGYMVDSSLTHAIDKLFRKKHMTIFLGTWCGDSRREVPRMLKILDASGVRENQVTLIMVSNEGDMYKQSPQHEEKDRNIIRVPTFIISEGMTEIGRIIESPKQSLEKDLMLILEGKEYIPNYAAGQIKK